jgi:hypothetical protein
MAVPPNQFYWERQNRKRFNPKLRTHYIDYTVCFVNIDGKAVEELDEIIESVFGDLMFKIKQETDANPDQDYAAIAIVDEHLPGGSIRIPFVRVDQFGADMLAAAIEKILQWVVPNEAPHQLTLQQKELFSFSGQTKVSNWILHLMLKLLYST